MGDLSFAEDEQHKSLNNSVDCNLDGQDLMAVDALMRIIDGVYTPKQVTIVINTT